MTNDCKHKQAQNLGPELEIYQTYQEVIAPLILTIEVVDGEFPIEILNEIRSIFTHLSRYKLQNSEKDLASAQRHVKRAVLDCYKYLCVSYFEEVKRFRHEHKGIDLTLADNGNFLPTLDEKEKQAKQLLLEAKKFEITLSQKMKKIVT